MLSLSDNSITDLPPEISNCSNLTFLNLRNNKIKSVSGLLSNYANLERLYLGGNLITEIPEDIENCQNLLELDLAS